MDPRFSSETLTLLQILAKNAPPEGGMFNVEIRRQKTEELHEKANAALMKTFQGTLEERTVKTNSAEIPISIYTPTNANKDKLGIYFHGGGWVVGSPKTHQAAVNYLAETTKMVWISVDYRLAPEHKFPIWLDDSIDVAQYILQNKASYGVNEKAKVGVAGDSAGGMISAVVAREVKGIDFQILVYAGLDLRRQAPSYREFDKPMYFLTSEAMDWLIGHAYDGSKDFESPRASVILNTSFEGLPPCLLILADLDPLRDDNIEYQKLLDKAGVSTKLVLVKGVLHGFFSLPGLFPQACAESMNAIEEFVKSI